jgi:hypothetical protein
VDIPAELFTFSFFLAPPFLDFTSPRPCPHSRCDVKGNEHQNWLMIEVRSLSFLVIDRQLPQTFPVAFLVSLLFFSPTHKRTEGHAPVWVSEFTSKAAALQGDLAEISPTPNVKLCDLVVWWSRATAFLAQQSLIFFLNLFGPPRRFSNLRPKNPSRKF